MPPIYRNNRYWREKLKEADAQFQKQLGGKGEGSYTLIIT